MDSIKTIVILLIIVVMFYQFSNGRVNDVCYLLEHSTGHTYVGVTNNLDRRLHQHNGLLPGGAVATTSRGPGWKRVLYINGFPNRTEALRFEWRFKQLTQNMPLYWKPIERRYHALMKLLELPRPTVNSILYSDYPQPLTIVCEQNETWLETFRERIEACGVTLNTKVEV